jgi:pre-mRNA cleavage complex 2 protein Pcf11
MWTSVVIMSKVSKEVAEDYESSLSDLTVNSKPLINMLTMLADENITHAPVIAQAVEKHLQKVCFQVLLDIVAS